MSNATTGKTSLACSRPGRLVPLFVLLLLHSHACACTPRYRHRATAWPRYSCCPGQGHRRGRRAGTSDPRAPCAGNARAAKQPVASGSPRRNAHMARRPVVCKNGLRLASECSGLEPTPYALQLLGIRPDQYRIVHCCENDPFARRFIVQNHGIPAEQVAGDIFDRDPRASQRPHIYVAGFPCQPFSSLGKRLGLADSAGGRVAGAGRGQVVHEVLRYLRVQLPAAFVLENVQGFMTIKGGAVLKWLLRELRGLGGQAYDVSYRLLNSEDHGRPQHRKRLFILGLLKVAQHPGCKFAWPAPARRRTLKSCLKGLAVACRSRAWPRLTGHGRKMLAQVRAKAAKAGLDINTDLVVADVYGSRPHYMVNRMPTITRTRGAQGGFLITRARRFTTAAELLALQGFPVHALDLRGIPERQQGMLAGNAITVHVLARILARALPAVKLARGLRDPCTNEVF